MRNVYLIQVSDAFSSSSDRMYLPYAVGTLAAKAWSNPEICREWCLKKIIYRRENPESAAASLQSPAVAAFSNYVWNFEYNLRLAQIIKKNYPECMIMFGGHSVSPDGKLLEKYPFIDVLMFGEGEETFEKLLLSAASSANFSGIPNIAFRDGETIVYTESEPATETEYPSPYTMGIFNDIMMENPSTSFSAILETNRGCPYHCAYCDWGPMNSKVRMFPISRIEADIKWFSENRIDYVWGADGNFGLFERDKYIADLMVDAKKKTGYPQQIKVNYAKLNGENVFYITKKFAENGLSKSTTLSLQSTSEDALRITGRKNMSSDMFGRLVSVYRQNSIPTYTELVLGLPGETKETFFNGIGEIIASGQHSVIEVYDCLVLPNSTMANPEYIDRYKIKTVHLPYVQQHTSSVNFDVTEYNDIVVSTCSLSADERNDCRYLAVVVQCFHSMGLMRNVAIYLYLRKKIKYNEFYKGISEWLLSCNDKIWNIFPDIFSKISNVKNGINEQYFYDDKFGDVYWPMDEGAFLKIVENYEEYFSDIRAYLTGIYGADDEFLEVLEFQKACVRLPRLFFREKTFSCNFVEYFEAALENSPIELKKSDCIIKTDDVSEYEKFSDYAREIVWFGRRNQKTTLNF